MPSHRPWWATWPGALALGVVSLLMVTTTAGSLLVAAMLPGADVSGTDVDSAASGPSMALRIALMVGAALCLAFPVATVVVARRAWLGWVLVTMAGSAFALAASLYVFGIL